MVAHADKPELHVDTVAEWERWLESDSDPGGVRLRLRKKASKRPGITYAKALDVALCFGWIDGQSQALDADYFLQAFTPRRAKSVWSKVNTQHVARLIAEGRMRPAGQAEIDRAKADGRWSAARPCTDGSSAHARAVPMHASAVTCRHSESSAAVRGPSPIARAASSWAAVSTS